ncbi:ribosomal RNA small subunit methyltransferase A [Patescibacteria group bacterium]|nr:ribosomal RNA small subunit methyltransferase A [Patescibacteria group bacterium]
MDLISKKNIKALLKKYQTSRSAIKKIYPSKRLGQNFLIDKNVVKKVIKAAELHSKDIVLEVGPGIGALTQEIAKKTDKVIAVEKDPKMVEILKETLKDFKNIEIINKDILKFNNYSLLTTNYKLIANLPFYITAPVIRKFLESKNTPKEMILIVQKEVAQRICSKPPKMNILAVSVQFYAKPKIISYISKKSFWPSPKVDSAIIKIVPQKKYKDVDIDLFFKIVKAGFAHPRKQLANNLTNGLELNKQEVNDLLLKNDVQPTQRAETLTINNWIQLTKML